MYPFEFFRVFLPFIRELQISNGYTTAFQVIVRKQVGERPNPHAHGRPLARSRLWMEFIHLALRRLCVGGVRGWFVHQLVQQGQHFFLAFKQFAEAAVVLLLFGLDPLKAAVVLRKLAFDPL